MEFKNFENKLIIEKITNYCIENNINAQEINALTAKIKFGKLDQNILNEDWKKLGAAAGLGGAATYAAPLLGAAAAGAAAIPGAIPFAVGAGAAALGKKLYQRGVKGTIDDAKKGLSRFGNKFTKDGRYKNAIDDVQTNLTTALNSLEAAEKLLGNDDEGIFKKYDIVMDNVKKEALQDAVTELKQAMDKYVGNVKFALANVNGDVSGAGQSNWDNKHQVPFEKLFPDLMPNGKLEIAYTKAYGKDVTGTKTLTPDDKKDLEKILKRSRLNIVKTLQNPNLDSQEFVNFINSKVEKIITGLESPNPKEIQIAFQSLHTIAITNPTSIPAPDPAPTKPTKPILKQTNVENIINGQGGTKVIHDIYKNELNLTANYDLMKDNYENYYQKTNYESLMRKIQGAMSSVTLASKDPEPPIANPAITKKLIDAINSALEHG